jgi:phage gp36-like protein
MSVSVTQLRARFDEQILIDLTDRNGTTLDLVKLDLALTDAGAQIEGYLFNLPESDRPPTATLDVHQVALALNVLAGNRPGVDFDSIRSRAKDAIGYLEGLSKKASIGLDVETSGPDAQITTTDLDTFQGKDLGT